MSQAQRKRHKKRRNNQRDKNFLSCIWKIKDFKKKRNRKTQNQDVKPSIASRDIKVNFAKAWLVDESDVDHYLKAMREALLNEINTGKRINL